jgi:purine-binding chemotaxis protein CheW
MTCAGKQTLRGSMPASDMIQYVTVVIGGQLFGLPISQVHDVFVPESVTRVPMSAPEVAGVLNLRGRIVTAINMRRCCIWSRSKDSQMMAVGIEYKHESYGLVIDTVGEVLTAVLASAGAEPVQSGPPLGRDLRRRASA